MMPSLLAISFMVGLAYVNAILRYGHDHGSEFDRHGKALSVLGTLLGWLGVALTGTDAGSNALFGNCKR
jgi:lactate permease